MLTLKQIQEVEFASKGGRYEREDVDIFLSDVAADYERLQTQNSELMQKLGILADKIEEYKRDENSIHTALVGAQRLADQMIKDAEVKAKEITDAADSHSRLTIAEADHKLSTAVAIAAKKSDDILALATEKSEAMVKAAAETVQTQHNLFMKMKAEATAFRSGMLSAYKIHVEQLDTLTNMLEKEPTYAAEYAAKKVDLDKTAQEDLDSVVEETIDEIVKPMVEVDAEDEEESISEDLSYETSEEVEKYEEENVDNYDFSETSNNYAPSDDYDDYDDDAEDEEESISEDLSYETSEEVEEDVGALTRRERRAKGGFKVESSEEDELEPREGGGVFDTMRFTTDIENEGEDDNLDEKSGFGFFKRRKK